MHEFDIDFSEVRYRIEGRQYGITLPTLFGSVTRPRLTAVIITDQGLWNFQQQKLMKEADKYLSRAKRHCHKKYGWRNIKTEYVFRTHQVDAEQPRDEFYWDVQPKKKKRGA